MAGKPTFAFVTLGNGAYQGSTVRDLTLANRLHRRGFKVVIYWMLERGPGIADPGIEQRLLCRGSRYAFSRPSEFMDRIVGAPAFLLPQELRVRATQRFNGLVDRLLVNLTRAVHEAPGADAGLVRRLCRFLVQDEVSHLMVGCAALGPLALAAKRQGGHAFDYVLTFQGDGQFAEYARRGRVWEPYQANLREVVKGTPWPALVASRDHLLRISEELGIPRECLSVIGSGVEIPEKPARPPLWTLKNTFPRLVEKVPIVTYLGRQDSDKGIDLLLYAVKRLQMQGIELQLVICGSTTRGGAYRKVTGDLAAHLGVAVHHAGTVSSPIRDALFAHSHCVVCPSIDREVSGLVVAEAMSQGTPVLVPDCGGASEMIQEGDKAGGLLFRTLDSGDLACQLGHLLRNRVLRQELASNARLVAKRFSAERMADRVLQHLAIPFTHTESPEVESLPSAVAR